jgi:signal peptidase I
MIDDKAEFMTIIPDQALTEQIEPEKPLKKSFWQSIWGEIIQTILLALIFYFAIDAVFMRVEVLNISMQPTLYEGDLLLVNKLAYKLGKMQTGDVITFHNPNDVKEDYIKRLIGKPGDVVKVVGGMVSVNGTPLTEPYLKEIPEYSGEWVVPDGFVFVLGDNRNNSSDSHSWGFVPEKDLVGKAMVVYWPLNAVKTLSHPDYGFPVENTSP